MRASSLAMESEMAVRVERSCRRLGWSGRILAREREGLRVQGRKSGGGESEEDWGILGGGQER
jgi:hypothetical protein